MLATITPVMVLYFLMSGMCSPFRWGMYIDAWRSTVPINFYGRVLDDNGRPVDHVEVHVRIAKVNPAFIFGGHHWLSEDKFIVYTDKNGQFTISKRRGRSLSIETMTKAGYSYERQDNKVTSFYYYPGTSIHHADPHEPVEFLLRYAGQKP